ncbi:MAG: hypothetical protein ACI9DJ_001169, partial [Algoriphagus sp.]
RLSKHDVCDDINRYFFFYKYIKDRLLCIHRGFKMLAF